MAINYVKAQTPVQPKKKSGGLTDFISPLASIAGGAAAIGTGGLAGLAGGLGVAGGLLEGKAIHEAKDAEKAQVPQTPQPQQTQVDTAVTRRLQSFEDDPYNILKQGMMAAGSLPQDMRAQAMPALLPAFMTEARKRQGGGQV